MSLNDIVKSDPAAITGMKATQVMNKEPKILFEHDMVILYSISVCSVFVYRDVLYTCFGVWQNFAGTCFGQKH